MTETPKIIFGLPDEREDAGQLNNLIRALQDAGQWVETVEPLGTAARNAGGLRDYWQEVIRDLEEKAPCCFFLSLKSASAWTVKRLSNRVIVVPLLFDDNQQQYVALRHIAHYCNAVVAMNGASRQRLFSDLPAIAPRIAPFPTSHGTSADWSEAAAACISLVEKLRRRADTGVFRRKPARMTVSSAFVGQLGGAAAVHSALHLVNRIVPWPDRRLHDLQPTDSSSGVVAASAPRIVVTVPSGRISGVDIFSVGLVRGLRERGMNAEVLQTMADEKTSDALPDRDRIVARQLVVPEYPTWKQRWKSLSAYLSAEPTVYIPNYDYRHSSVVPTLPHSTKALGIAHSDDPSHYEHIARLAPYWDAVVAVSTVIHDHLLGIVPSLKGRLHTVPYGVEVPAQFATAPRSSSEPLRAVYTGRVVQYQKRAFDLINIAREMTARRLPGELAIVGSGEDSYEFQAAAAPHFLSGAMRWIGSLSNDEVIDVFRQSHVLVLPSRFEGLPLSLLEAMANGVVPIVTSIRSGIPEVIRDGENGFVVPVGDAKAIADAMALLAADEHLRVRMARAAYETVRERYSLELMLTRYAAVIELAMSNRHARPAGKILPPRSIRFFPTLMPTPPLPVRRAVSRLRAALQ